MNKKTAGSIAVGHSYLARLPFVSMNLQSKGLATIAEIVDEIRDGISDALVDIHSSLREDAAPGFVDAEGEAAISHARAVYAMSKVQASLNRANMAMDKAFKERTGRGAGSSTCDCGEQISIAEAAELVKTQIVRYVASLNGKMPDLEVHEVFRWSTDEDILETLRGIKSELDEDATVARKQIKEAIRRRREADEAGTLVAEWIAQVQDEERDDD